MRHPKKPTKGRAEEAAAAPAPAEMQGELFQMCNQIRNLICRCRKSIFCLILALLNPYDPSALGQDQPQPSLITRLAGPSGNVAEFSKDGTSLLIADFEAAQVWDLKHLKPRTQRLTHGGLLRSAALSADGDYAITVGTDDVRGWDVETGQEIFLLKHDVQLASASFNSAGDCLLSVGKGEHAVRVIDARTGKVLQTTKGREAIYFAAFDPTGEEIAAITEQQVEVQADDRKVFSRTQHVVFFDSRTGEELRRHKVDDYNLQRLRRRAITDDLRRRPLAFCGDVYARMIFNDVVLSVVCGDGAEQHQMKVWDLAGRPPDKIVFSADGRRVLTVTGSVQIWDATEHNQLIRQIQPPDGEGVAEDAVFSPDGSLVLIGGGNGYGGIWDVASGGQILSVSGRNANNLAAIAYAADASRIAIGFQSDEATAVWKVPAP